MLEIIRILKNSGAIKFGDFELASGKQSKYYIDVKLAATKPLALTGIRDMIVEGMFYQSDYTKMWEWFDSKKEYDYITCVELGGVPIGVMVSVKINVPLIIVRKAAKDHGIGGRLVGDFEKGKKALLIEDVTTTGGSSLSAVKVLRDAGLLVDTVITVVDRQEGAEEALKAAGVKLIALTTAKEILDAQGMNCQLSGRCTSISPQTKMQCDLPAGHSKDHRNGDVGWLTKNDPADVGREW